MASKRSRYRMRNAEVRKQVKQLKKMGFSITGFQIPTDLVDIIKKAGGDALKAGGVSLVKSAGDTTFYKDNIEPGVKQQAEEMTVLKAWQLVKDNWLIGSFTVVGIVVITFIVKKIFKK